MRPKDIEKDFANRITLTDRLAILISCVAFPYFFIFRHYSEALSNAVPVIMLSFLLVVLLNRFKLFNASRFLLLISANVTAAYYAASFGQVSGIYFLFFAYIGLPLVIFGFNEFFKSIIGSLIPLACLLYLELTNYYSPTPVVSSPEFQNLVRITAVFFVCAIIVLSLTSFLRTLSSFYSLLVRTNDDLSHTNETLSETVRQLEESNVLVQSLSERAAIGAVLRGVAHEVKNPIVSILASCSNILMMPLDEEIRLEVDAIKGNIKRLSDLTATLLKDSGAIINAKVSVEMNPLFDQMIRLVQQEARFKGVEFTTDIPSHLPSVVGTAAYISQAILNLIVNALHYTPQGGKVGIHVSVLEDTQMLCVRVSDSGPGINPEVQASLFDYGVTTASPGGVNVGLGLHFVKRVMDAHGGTISVQSEMGKGTVFELCFKINDEREPITL